MASEAATTPVPVTPISNGARASSGKKSNPRSKSTESSASPKRKRAPSKPKQSVWSIHRYLSKNPDKAWAELFFLKYSIVWPVLFGLWAGSGLHLKVGDLGNLLVSIIIASPNFIYPYLYCPTSQPESKATGDADVNNQARNVIRPFYDTFWFKYLLWLFIFTFVATYFWSEYFFDVLGMKYAFPHLQWNFDSVLVGTGRQRVPLMMLVSYEEANEIA